MFDEPLTVGFRTPSGGLRRVPATWVGVADLEPGRTLVVEGPSVGMWWRNEDRVVGVRSVDVVGDRTNTRVLFTNDDPEDENAGAWGSWSRMRFLAVDLADVPL